MDFVDDQSVRWKNVAVLKPATRYSRRHHDHLPARCFGCRFAFAVYDPHPERIGAKYGFGNWADGERLSCAGSSDDSEAFSGCGELSNLGAVLLLENGRDAEPKSQLDRFAR